MPAHRFFLPSGPPLVTGPLVIGGEEGRHAARVKRLTPGQAVEVLDGQGSIATGSVVAIEKIRGEWAAQVDLASVRHAEPIRPRVVVLCPAPKGDRLPQMIEGLSQVGAASWRPLLTERTVSEPGAAKIDRLQRISEESAKQCGRAWTLSIGPPLAFAEALALPSLVIADASGPAFQPAPDPELNLLVGPEGGWSVPELDAARAAGAAAASFGPHVMRLETAAVVAAALAVRGQRP